MVVLTDFAERALKRITPMYENSEFIQEFFNGISFDDVRAYFKTLREQSFIQTVDTLIETQEHKYSLEPRPDLTLEQRRARLGIKAAVHRPLNPKILEQAIKNYYGLETYLFEGDPGFIWLCANYMTEDGFNGIIEFLETEKPAHLGLKVLFNFEEYTGGKVDDMEPRIFAGVAIDDYGETKIDLPKPDNALVNLRVSTGQFVEGQIKIYPALPDDVLLKPYAGVALNVEGEITIGCQKVYIPYSPNLPVIYPEDSPIVIPPDNPLDPIVDPEYKPSADPEIQEYYFLENPIAQLAIADKTIARGAEDFITPIDEIDSIEYDTVKLFFNFPISKHRRVRGVAMPNARNDLTEKEIQAVGQYAVDNKLITNTAGELASSVTKAALKTREVTRIF